MKGIVKGLTIALVVGLVSLVCTAVFRERIGQSTEEDILGI